MEVEGDEFGVVRCFPYLGDMLDGGGGADAAVSARIRCGWKKFQEMAPFLSSRAPSLKMKGRVFKACARSALLYGSDAWPMTVDNERKIARADSRMMRRMCGVRLAGRATQEEVRILTGLEVVGDVMVRRRLRWYGHVLRKNDRDWVKRVWRDWEVPGPRHRGRPRKTWEAAVVEDCTKLRLSAEDAQWKI